MDIEKYIVKHVKLFKNKIFFQSFSDILNNIYNNIDIYNRNDQIFINNKQDNSNLFQNKNNKVSYWFIIMKIILNKLELFEKEIFKENNLKINTLVFSYLVKLCKEKIQKLYKLSLKEKTSLNNLIFLYLDLSEQAIFPEKFIKNNNKKTIKKIKLFESTNKYNVSQSSRFYSTSKTKINKNNNKKQNLKLLSLSNINHIDNSQEDDENEENNVKKKYGIGRKKLLYKNSLSRLFIGEIDEKSVKEKYLMNITVKREQKIKFNGINMSKAESYAKGLINEINIKKGKYKGVIIDQNLAKTIAKFHKEQKLLEEYKKNLNEKNSVSQHLKKKIKFNKTIQIFNSNDIKNLHGSASCFDFRTFHKIDDNKKLINNRKIILKKKRENEKKIIFDNYNHYTKKNRPIKLIMNKACSNSNMNKGFKNINRKITKYLNRLNKNTFNKTRRTEFQNYMNKRDFFYNDEYII